MTNSHNIGFRIKLSAGRDLKSFAASTFRTGPRDFLASSGAHLSLNGYMKNIVKLLEYARCHSLFGK